MSWQDDAMAEQEAADALWYMGEAEWKETYGEQIQDRKKTKMGMSRRK